MGLLRPVGRSGWVALALLLAAAGEPALAQGGRVADAFAGMSAEGRRVMSAAMLGTDSEPMAEAARAARERVLRLLEADPLDPQALAEAMRAEDELYIAQVNQRRQRMLAAYGQLSAADRRALAQASRAQGDPRRRSTGRMR